jgi:hypothetical protein
MTERQFKNKNKKNDFSIMTRVRGIEPPPHTKELIEYKISEEFGEEILRGDKSNRTPQEKLCDFVNTQFNFKGYCVKVSYF